MYSGIPRALWSPFMLNMEKRQQEQDMRRLRSQPLTTWDMGIKLPRYKDDLLFLEAGSFQGWVDGQARQLGVNPDRKSQESIGDWTLDWFNIPTSALLSLWRSGKSHGRVGFSDAVWIPCLRKGRDVWMSLTPAEIFSLRAGLRGAKGHVVVGGLGMGWFARQIAANPKVKTLLIVDRCAQLLDRFGKPLEKEFPKKVTLRHGDFYEVMEDSVWETVPELRVLADIWDSVGDHQWDSKWSALQHRLKSMKSKPFTWAW